MKQQNAIQIFEDKKVRTLWDPEQEKRFISIVDVIAVLTDSPNARKYWSVLKLRLKKEGSELTTNCSQLKMMSSDGKYYKTDVADTEQPVGDSNIILIQVKMIELLRKKLKGLEKKNKTFMKNTTKHILLTGACLFVLGHSSCTNQQEATSNPKATNPKEEQPIAYQKLKDEFCDCISNAMYERDLDVKGSLVACNSYFFKSTNKSFEALEREILKTMPDSSMMSIDHIIYKEILMASFETCVKQGGFDITNKDGALFFLRNMKENPPIELVEDQISNIQYEHTREIFEKIKNGQINSIANEFDYIKNFNINKDTLFIIHRLIKDLRGKYIHNVDSTQKSKITYITQVFEKQNNNPICEIRYEYQNQGMFPKVNKIILIDKEQMITKPIYSFPSSKRPK